MTPDEALAWLYGLQRFGIKLGLQNVRRLLDRLGNPQAGLPCVHVAGTNGKGSVSVLLAEMLGHAGLRVGLYTSPHLHSFTERVNIAGMPVTEALLAELAEEVRTAARGIPATFFEATTALALLAFRRSGVEVAVLETGLGGRLDATNVVEPDLCLITPVSLDHQEHLGSDLATIAAEKAGIIKPGIPVVSGEQPVAAAEVIAAAAGACGAPLWQVGRDFDYGGNHAAMWFRAPETELAGLTCSLPGRHQLANYALALAGAVRLRRDGWKIADAALRRAGVTARWPGRLEWFGDPPAVLLDGAHNVAGAEALAAYLAGEVRRPVRLVAALSGQRRPEEVLAPLAGQLRALYAAPVPEGTGAAPEALVEWARTHAVPARSYLAADVAFAAAVAERTGNEVVVAAGSLYLVAAVRRLLTGTGNAWDEGCQSPPVTARDDR